MNFSSWVFDAVFDFVFQDKMDFWIINVRDKRVGSLLLLVYLVFTHTTFSLVDNQNSISRLHFSCSALNGLSRFFIKIQCI